MSGSSQIPPALAAQLLSVARQSVAHALTHGRALPIVAGAFAAELRAPGACFVSVHRGGALRGCIGSIEPQRALVVDVSENACAAVLHDFRFERPKLHELAELEISIHVLGALQPLAILDLKDLCRQLRPPQDGLVLELGARRGLFLPVMWERLPQPTDFVAALLHKAGVARGASLAGLRAWRFGAQHLVEAAPTA